MKDHRDELVQTFREMGEGELQERWSSGRLTEVAIEVARAELARRGLEAPDVAPPPDLDEDLEAIGDVSFVTVARSLEPMQIEILRARLQAEGIAAFSLDAGMNQTNSLYSIALGGVRLMVPREAVQEARNIIALLNAGILAARENEEADPE